MKSRKPISRTNSLAASLTRYSVGLTRAWRIAKNGTPFRLSGWWDVRKCTKCGEPRYAYERIGTIFANKTPNGEYIYRRKAFPAAQVDAKGWIETLRPAAISKPELTCRCD